MVPVMPVALMALYAPAIMCSQLLARVVVNEAAMTAAVEVIPALTPSGVDWSTLQ